MDTQQARDNFLKLILENKRIIIKICNSYCANKNYREDLAQEITFHLWKSGDHFNAGQKFSTWMYRVALNVAISFYRKEKTAIPSRSFADGFADIEDKSDGADAVEENITLLQLFINELNELDKALMILFLEEKSYAEIADILGISETNVATKISRIKKRIKQNFSALNK
jgi:RNA polymerase sigma-70 factor (ECF subfamily)